MHHPPTHILYVFSATNCFGSAALPDSIDAIEIYNRNHGGWFTEVKGVAVCCSRPDVIVTFLPRGGLLLYFATGARRGHGPTQLWRCTAECRPHVA